jgi:glutaredoxin-like YruB-family protein
MIMKKVAIYSTPVCKYCNLAKDFFKENSIEYTEFNVAADPIKRQELVQKSGQLGVPVITIDNHVVVGYNERVLRELLLTESK